MSEQQPRWLILGNPENRRVTLFHEALVAQGYAPAIVISWLEYLQRPESLAELSDKPSLLRIDSFGESFEVERHLLRWGVEAEPESARLTVAQIEALQDRRGEILAPHQAHTGLVSALRRLDQFLAKKSKWRVLSPVNSIVDLFDKRTTSRLYEGLGVPVPPRLDGVESFEQLREAVRDRDWDAAFVKLSCGSSASCLGIYQRTRDRESFLTTMEVTDDGWYNNLRLQRITHPRRLEQVIGFLLEEGSHIEQAIPKARLGEDNFDCRIVVVAGEPAFLVVRQNSHPITNLHLAGRRGDVEAFRRAVPDVLYEAAMESCRRIGKAHGCLAIGVDLMFEEGFAGHYVLEGNAFGDLLPNIRRDGLSVYEWEIREATRAVQ